MTVGIPTQLEGKAMFTITVHYSMRDTKQIVTDNPVFYVSSLDMLAVQDVQIERNYV